MFSKIGVIGSGDSVLAFKAVGLEVFSAGDGYQARELVRKLSKENFAVIFITEDLAKENEDLLERAKTKTYPAIIPIPTSAGSTGFGLEGVKRDSEKALGVDILFNKK